MKILRRRVRRSFLFAAIGFLILGFADIARQNYASSGVSPIRHFGFIAFCLLQGGIYAAAWFTTKMPSPYRNNWAVVGSFFTLAWAGYDLWLRHADILSARAGLIGLVLGVAGLYVFGQGGSPAMPQRTASETVQEAQQATPSTPSASYQTGYVPAGERVMRSYKIPSEATASSAAVAAAAKSSEPLEPPWDPVAMIRSGNSVKPSSGVFGS